MPVRAALYWASLHILYGFTFGYPSDWYEFQQWLQSFKYVFKHLGAVCVKLYRREPNPHGVSVRLQALAVCQRNHYGSEIP